MSDIAVSIKNLVKTYHSSGGDVAALRSVNLDIMNGELLMLSGPSGCGKTTLISIISGILEYDAGECLVFGNNFNLMQSGEKCGFRARNIGFIFQAFNLIPTLTLMENIAVPLIILGQEEERAHAAAKEMMGKVGLQKYVDFYPSQVSGGQQQRVAIGRALVHNPKLIVCDEPTSSLDHKTGVMVVELMKDMVAQNGATLVIVTHDNRIYNFADRIAYMEDGSINSITNNVVAA